MMRVRAEVAIRRVLVFVSGLAVLGAFGCGSEAAGGDCGKVQPCGGDIVGDWKIVEDCVSDQAVTMTFAADLAAYCPTVTGRIVSLTETGSMTFTDTLAYSGSATLSGSFDMNLPASCLAVGCGEVTAAFRAEVAADPGSPITSVSCSGTGSCVCRFNFGPLPTADAGTYTTSGGTVTMASTVNGYAKDFGYCIAGNTGHLMSVQISMSVGSMGQVTIVEDTVVVRQ